MAKNPDDRYASASELAEAARTALSAVPRIGRASPWTASPGTGIPTGGGGGGRSTLAPRPPTVTSPQPPHRLPPPAPPPSESGIRAYFGGAPHYTGLATVALIIPLVVAGVVPLDWTAFPVAVLLYALGAVAALAAPRRPPGDRSIGP